MSDGHNQGEIAVPQTSFENRQREYFADLLGRKWECNIPGHTVCVPTEDNQHYQLSDENFMTWVNALCLGEATTSQPPDGLLMPKSSVDEPSTSVVRAVSIPPSHRRNVRSPMLAATASIHESLSSRPSSGTPGPGYYSGKAIDWFGRKCIGGIERVIIFKRCWQYQYRLKQWSSSKGDTARRKRDKQFFAILEDLLELSRECYSDRAKKRALAIAYRASKLPVRSASIFTTKEEALNWRIRSMMCFIPINLAYYSKLHSSSDLDLIHDLRDSLTKVPLELQDTEAATSVIHILASGLIYSTHETRLTWRQGQLFCNILLAIRMLRDLTVEEMDVIHNLAMRRLERHTQTSEIFCRPWEVTIVGICSTTHPWVEDLVRGPCGIPSLVLVLDTLLEMDIESSKEDYSRAIADALGALGLLASYHWITEIATEQVVARIVMVLVRQVGEVNDRFNCLRILDHIFAHRPPLLHEFVELGGRGALLGTLSFITSQPPSVWELHEDIRNQSIKSVNKLLRRIEQASSTQ